MPLVLVDAFPTKVNNSTTQITPIRHTNYYILKDLVARCKIADINCLPSCQQIEDKEGIGRSSVSRQVKLLVKEGWLRRLELSNSRKGIYYQISIDKNKAVEYRNMFTPTGRKKKSKNEYPCDNNVILRGF